MDDQSTQDTTGITHLLTGLGIQQDPSQLDHFGRVLGDVDAVLVTCRRDVDDDVAVQLRRGGRSGCHLSLRGRGRNGGRASGQTDVPAEGADRSRREAVVTVVGGRSIGDGGGGLEGEWKGRRREKDVLEAGGPWLRKSFGLGGRQAGDSDGRDLTARHARQGIGRSSHACWDCKATAAVCRAII